MSDRKKPPGGGTNLPAKVKPKNQLLQFKALAELADQIVEREEEINRLRREIPEPDDSRYNIDDLIKQLPNERLLALNDNDRELLARAKALLEQLDPRENYQDVADDEEADNEVDVLKRSVVAERLAVMLGAFPGSQPASPQAFLE